MKHSNHDVFIYLNVKLNLIIYFNLIYFCHCLLLIKVEMRSS